MLNKKQRVFFFFLFFLFFIFCSNFALAIEFRAPEINYPSLPFPGVDSPQVFLEKIKNDEISGEQAFPLYVKYFYYLFLMIAGLLALGVIIYGGFLYLISAGTPVKMIAAKEQITGGILGFVILLSSYLILATINPQLVILRLPGLEKITLPEIEIPEPGERELPKYFQIPLGMIIENAVVNEKGQAKLNNAKMAAKDARKSAEILKNLAAEMKNLTSADCGTTSGCDENCSGGSCPKAVENKAEITEKIAEINDAIKMLRVSLTPGEMTPIGFIPGSGYCSVDYLSQFWTEEALGPLWRESLPIEAAKVCDCESGGNPMAIGPTGDYGLFQIHFKTWKGWWGLERREQLYDVNFNIDFAIKIYKRNNSWWPWVCARKLRIVR